ncbi:MAG: metallophosphoesterase [Syntrophales bacterium]
MKIVRRLLSVFLLGLLLWGCSSSSSQLTVTASIRTSDAQESLATVDPPREIFLEFSEPLNRATIAGNVSLQVVTAGGVPAPIDPPVEVVADAHLPNRVIIRTRDGAKLPSGREFRLAVTRGIVSAGGAALAQEYVRFFATDYDLTLPVAGAPGANRAITIVISDLHLGDQRSIDRGYGWFNKNRAVLVNFLNHLRQRPDVKEIVIAGDLFDEWVAPVEYDAFGGATQSGFVDAIASANRPVIEAFNRIIADGAITVTYVPGNHDMLVAPSDVQRIFPGISQARDAQGLGTYTPPDRPELVIEHGHRYDFFNAPDPISNRSITGTASLLSPGFFVSKIAVTSDIERGQTSFYREGLNAEETGLRSGDYFSYWVAWQLIMTQKPVKDSWDKKMIVTGADGYTGTYAIRDLIPHHDSGSGPLDVTLYKGIIDTWNQRQTINNVPVPIPAAVAIAAGALNPVLDAQSLTQYFWNTSADRRIVVFGHTHQADLFPTLNHKGRWSVYANSGTWVDHSLLSCTFVAILPKKENGATTETVTVYRYVDDTHIQKIKSAAIRD